MMNCMEFIQLATHVGLHHFLLFSAILFAIGLFGLLTKKGLIPLLMCVELMLNAVNINLVAFNHYMPVPDYTGQLMAIFAVAVAVLIVMAIMLTRRDDMSHSNPSRSLFYHAAAAAVTGLFLLGMAAVAILSPFHSAPQSLGDAAPGLADLMLTHYTLPFEVTAVLLLIAMIGAIVLAKGADES